MVWTADGIPSLKNYEQALYHVDTRKPYQKNSSYAGQKPWGGNRRYTRSLIRKDTVNGIENVVVCSYYGTDVLSYFPDGTIKISQIHASVRRNGETVNYLWDSPSTGLVIKAGLGTFQPNPNQYFIDRIARTRSQNYYIDNNKQYHLIREGLTILPSGEVEGGTVEHVYTLNKAKMATLRKKYKEFIDYSTLLLKFNDNVTITSQDTQLDLAKYNRMTTDSSILKHRGSDDCEDSRAAWFDDLDAALTFTNEEEKTEVFYKLFQFVSVHAAKREWSRQTQFSANGLHWQLICEPERFKEYVYDLIRYEYAYMLFDKEIANKERPAPAANRKYVSYGRQMPRASKTNLQDVSVSQ
jgi:hypothetical protein